MTDKDDLYALGYAPGATPMPYQFQSGGGPTAALMSMIRFLARELYDLKYSRMEDSAESHVPYLDAN